MLLLRLRQLIACRSFDAAFDKPMIFRLSPPHFFFASSAADVVCRRRDLTENRPPRAVCCRFATTPPCLLRALRDVA